jgi:hypothetical protein
MGTPAPPPNRRSAGGRLFGNVLVLCPLRRLPLRRSRPSGPASFSFTATFPPFPVASCQCYGRRCAAAETRDSRVWCYWPPKGGPNPGQPPHHRVCNACKASLHTDNLVKEEHRASRCGLDYDCPDGACGPNGC